MTVTEFLEARIAEDEAAARRCAEAFPGSWDVEDRGYRAHVACDATSTIHVSELDQQYTNVEWIGGALQMIAGFNPARVLAECQAKRAIVEGHGPHDHGGEHGDAVFCDECQWDHGDDSPRIDNQPVEGFGTHPCRTLRALAGVYADHPDYDKDWAL